MVVAGSVVSSILTFVAAVVASRYGLLGKRVESATSEMEQLYRRIHVLEERDAKCQAEIAQIRAEHARDTFKMKSDMQTILLGYVILSQQVPDSDKKVDEIMENLAKRYQDLLEPRNEPPKGQA